MRNSERRRALAAALLVAARLSDDILFDELKDELRPQGERDAYAIQQLAHCLLSRGGLGPRVGWKIGCTTPVMQEYLGIANPCAGGMFQSNVWRGGHRFELPARGRLGVECELAVRLGDELIPDPEPVDEHRAADAVATCMAAIEVVEDRYCDYGALDTETLIADDFFHHSCVLGEERTDVAAQSLRAARAEMYINDVRVGAGTGEDILGEPLSALAWLANAAASFGAPLGAGEIVLLGSLVQTQWVAPNDAVVVLNSPLGRVSADF